jgi:hypothetical protein
MAVTSSARLNNTDCFVEGTRNLSSKLDVPSQLEQNEFDSYN